MSIKFYPEEDAIYIRIFDLEIAYGKDLDDRRHLDFSQDGRVVGIEFLTVSDGVDLDDIPDVDMGELISLLDKSGIKMLA